MMDPDSPNDSTSLSMDSGTTAAAPPCTEGSDDRAPTLDELEARDNITVLRRGSKTYVLVGTAHVSQESVDEVRSVINAVKPDTVAIELCDTRYRSLMDENRWEKLNIFEVIKEGKTLMLIANLAIGAYQRRIGAQLGVKPGAEMLEAAKLAEEQGAEVFLADRDIQITLKRTWQNVGYFKRMALLGAMIESLVSKDEISADTIEDLKQNEQLSSMLDEFSKTLPEVKGPLIDERDLYMVSRLQEAPGETIVAVIGAGHMPGMTKHFDDDIDREQLVTLKPTPLWVRSLKWVIPTAVLLAFYYGYQQQGQQSLETLVTAWILPNAAFAAIFAAMAGAKIPTILIAGVSSPITSLNPLLNVGIPVGFCEAWLRKPTVADAERISDDVQSLRGFYRNAFTRTLLVVMFSIFGSALGAWVGIGWIGTLIGRG